MWWAGGNRTLLALHKRRSSARPRSRHLLRQIPFAEHGRTNRKAEYSAPLARRRQPMFRALSPCFSSLLVAPPAPHPSPGRSIPPRARPSESSPNKKAFRAHTQKAFGPGSNGFLGRDLSSRGTSGVLTREQRGRVPERRDRIHAVSLPRVLFVPPVPFHDLFPSIRAREYTRLRRRVKNLFAGRYGKRGAPAN